MVTSGLRTKGRRPQDGRRSVSSVIVALTVIILTSRKRKSLSPCPYLYLMSDDDERVTFYDGYLNGVLEAVVEDGVDVRSYFAWS